MSDILKFLFETSQLDADLVASVEEANKAEAVTIKKQPLLKALKALDIECEGLSTDEEGCTLVCDDSAKYHDILTKLGTTDAITSLAGEGWVAQFENDKADTTELPQYTIAFIPISEPEMSDDEKALTADQLNAEYEKGSDSHDSPNQQERDGKKPKNESILSEADDLIANPDANNSAAAISLTPEARASILQAAAKIESEADVKRFFEALVDGGINFHPDTDFDFYVDLKTDARIFDEDEASVLNRAMEDTFNVPDCDPYAVGADVLSRALGMTTREEG